MKPSNSPKRCLPPFLLPLVECVALPASDARPVRPNLLSLITDEQRRDAPRVAQREQDERRRLPWLTTRNMDRLAAAAARFRNAFVVQSLCPPSRVAFLTGSHNHANRVRDHSTRFPTHSVTVATQSRAAGCTMACIGRGRLLRHGKNPAWVESFDLKSDPYETSNLAGHPGSRKLLARRRREFESEARRVCLELPPRLKADKHTE